MAMAQRVSFRVNGMVQGVCFRDFTMKNASSLGLTGWVRNTLDGKVEGEAQGVKENLQKLLEAVESGPRMARVEKVESQDIETKEGEHKFRVVR